MVVNAQKLFSENHSKILRVHNYLTLKNSTYTGGPKNWHHFCTP